MGIENIPNKLKAGDDSVPNILVRDCRSVFVLLLCIINLPLKTNIYPDDVKLRELSSYLEIGKSLLLNNYTPICYRPIFVLLNFSKVMEQK